MKEVLVEYIKGVWKIPARLVELIIFEMFMKKEDLSYNFIIYT